MWDLLGDKLLYCSNFSYFTWWIGKVRVASYELQAVSCSSFASCELRADSEKCELVHLKCEL